MRLCKEAKANQLHLEEALELAVRQRKEVGAALKDSEARYRELAAKHKPVEGDLGKVLDKALAMLRGPIPPDIMVIVKELMRWAKHNANNVIYLDGELTEREAQIQKLTDKIEAIRSEKGLWDCPRCGRLQPDGYTCFCGNVQAAKEQAEVTASA